MTKMMRLKPIANIILAKVPKINEQDLKSKGGFIMSSSSDENFVNKYARAQCVAELVAIGSDVKKLFSEEDQAMLEPGTKVMMVPFTYKIIDNDDAGMKVLLQKILGVEKLFEDESKYHYIFLQSKDLMGTWEEINNKGE